MHVYSFLLFFAKPRRQMRLAVEQTISTWKMWQIIVQIIELQKWCNKDAKIKYKKANRSEDRENCVCTQKNGNRQKELAILLWERWRHFISWSITAQMESCANGKSDHLVTLIFLRFTQTGRQCKSRNQRYHIEKK
jgi:hypothetical protein